MKFKVPVIKQKHKMGCGPAAMSMVYKYFGKDISEQEIIKEIGGLTKGGSFTTDHALMAKNLGFQVICRSYNLKYFEPNDVKLSRADFIKKIKSLIKKEKRAYNKRELKSILRVLESNIDFRMEIPSLDTIKKFLTKKLPVLLAVNSAILFGEKRDLKIGHFIILTSHRKNKFCYIDPYGKNETILSDKLIFALSNNVFNSSAYLLVIKE